MQCLGQEVKDFKIKTRSLNFGRTIIETTRTFRNLFAIMPHLQFYKLLVNYVLVVPYQGEYIQVAGRMLNERFNMKAIGARRQPNESAQDLKAKEAGEQYNPLKPPPPIVKIMKYTKSFTYSTFPINRFQIFYCSDMNRSPGLFARSNHVFMQIFFSIRDSRNQYTSARLTSRCVSA